MTPEDITRATGLSKQALSPIIKAMQIKPLHYAGKNTPVYPKDTAERVTNYIANRHRPVAFDGYSIYASSMNY
jgi:hypothetical protein